MNLEVLAVGLLIALARVVDVSLGTIRTISVVQGRAFLAWILGFFEILIWLFAVSRVITNLGSPFYAICYALGYASGNFAGVKLENWLAFGAQVIRVFTREASHVTEQLRSLGFRVTTFDGYGREGPVNLLFIEAKRRNTRRLLQTVAQLDPKCFYLVDDVRLAAHPAMVRPTPTGWRAILKKK